MAPDRGHAHVLDPLLGGARGSLQGIGDPLPVPGEQGIGQPLRLHPAKSPGLPASLEPAPNWVGAEYRIGVLPDSAEAVVPGQPLHFDLQSSLLQGLPHHRCGGILGPPDVAAGRLPPRGPEAQLQQHASEVVDNDRLSTVNGPSYEGRHGFARAEVRLALAGVIR